MSNLSVVGVDLAKNVIQVSVVSRSNKELANKALTRKKFAEFWRGTKRAWSRLRRVLVRTIGRGWPSNTVTRSRSYRPKPSCRFVRVTRPTPMTPWRLRKRPVGPTLKKHP